MKFVIIRIIPLLTFLLSSVVYSADCNQDQGGTGSKELVVGNKKINDDNFLFSNSDISSTNIIGPKGGFAKLEGIMSVYFAENALPNNTKVILSTSRSDEIDNAFNEATIMFGAMDRLPQEISVNTGVAPPSSEYISTKMYIGNISSRFRISELSVFIGFEQGSSEEAATIAFDAVEYSYNQQEKTLEFNIPGAAFLSNELTKGKYQAIIILAFSKNT